MAYTVSPFAFVIILFFALRFKLMFPLGDEDVLGFRSMHIGFAPMIVIYIELLLLSFPVSWVVKYFFKLNLIGCFIFVLLTVFIASIPILLNLSSINSSVFEVISGVSIYVGVFIGVFVYSVVFYWLVERGKSKYDNSMLKK